MDTAENFLEEVREELDRAEGCLLTMERELRHRSLLEDLLRSFHSVKSAGKFTDRPELEPLIHSAEAFVRALLEGRLELTATAIAVLVTVIDAARVVADGAVSAAERGNDLSALIALLGRLQSRALSDGSALEESAEEECRTVLGARLGDLLVRSGRVSAAQVAEAVQRQVDGDRRLLGEILTEQGAVEAGEVSDMLALQAQSVPVRHHRQVRVPVEVMNELVHEGKVLVRLARSINQPLPLSRGSIRLESTALHVQQLIRSACRQPVRVLWSHFPRFLHDLSKTMGKAVRLETQGDELELDRSVMDAIQGPLVHLVRNAVDHGIEPPEERVRCGKAPEGVLRLRARTCDQAVVVEVSDDGAGIDARLLIDKAVRTGLLSAAAAETMTPEAALSLVFLPGLSLAPQVTQVSGRGVGLDVVRTGIESIGGRVEVDTRLHLGTVFRIRVPVTDGDD